MLADAAREYSLLGWALVALNGKNPIGYGWQQSQPLGPLEAYDIWSRRTSDNMGLVLGPSGVIDYEHDTGSLSDFLALVGGAIPQTPAFRTGSGKLHILFRDPGHLSRRTRDGFELRAGPHQSVLPPSIHPDTGKPYEWLNHPSEYPLLDPPQSLLDFFKVTSGGDTDGHWRGPLRSGTRLGEGEGRHASLVSFCGKMVEVCESEEQLVEAALVYSEMFHDPPYPPDVIEKQARDCWHRWRDVPETPDEAREFLHIKTADEIQMRSVEFLMKPFFQRAGFHLLTGRKGAGKGSLIAWAAAQMTRGQFGDRARPVLWIATEDSFEIDVKPRFVAQGGDPRMLLCVQQSVLLPQDMPAIRAVCEEWDVGMVVIDPIVGVIGGVDSNSEGPIVAAIGGLNALADELDLCVIGVRHLGKNIERGLLESVLGSAAWVNTPRAVLGIAQGDDGFERKVTMEILAGNRTRAREATDFHIGDKLVEGLDKPVSFVTPIPGPSSSSLGEILRRQ